MTSSTLPTQTTAEAVFGADGLLKVPAATLEALGVREGDRLTLSVRDGVLVATPNKVLARQALREIREGLAAAGITEEELQEEGRRIREERFRRRHGHG